MKMVFIGFYAEIGSIRLDRFGKRVEVPDALVDDAIVGGASVIPASEFDGIGFTERELKDFALVATHVNAPEEFIAKKRKAIEIYCSLRDERTKSRKGE